MSVWKKNTRNNKNSKRGLSALVKEVLWNPIAGEELWFEADDGEVNRAFVPGFTEVCICSVSAKDHHMKRVAKIMLTYKCF